MQYFKNREQAGNELVSRLERYRDSLSVVMALSAGGVLVGEPIATKLNLPMGMLAVEEVQLPWAQGPTMGAIDSGGDFSYNVFMSESLRNAYMGEYHSFVDQERVRLTHKINMMHVSSAIKRDNIRGKTVILVDDGMPRAFYIQQALNFLKPVRVPRIVVATPVSTLDTIDYMHTAVDEIHCLDVKNNYINTDHYYDQEEDFGSERLAVILDRLDIRS